MSKSRRWSEKWFHRGLWLVAFAFAACLIGLGGLVIGDLPQVERQWQRDDFIDKAAVEPLRAAIAHAKSAEDASASALDQASLKLQAAQKAYANGRDAFANWLETRKATNLPSQDDELIARTKALDDLKAAETEAQRRVDAQNQAILESQQARQRAQGQLETLEAEADRRLDIENGRADLRVFAYRLALTLPLVAIAVWLFRTRRKSPWWPFVWGFILFALFTFFVELVPYLPSYGGYVQYGVGLIVTLVVGRGAVLALNRYLAQQKLAEQQPDTLRRTEMNYDAALARLAKSLCPGCERPVDLKSGGNLFCPHCGIGLIDQCVNCSTRKSAFSPFCHACGARAGALAAPP